MSTPPGGRPASLFSNRLVRLVFLSRFVAAASAPVTLYLVAALRPATEQGFYFVFTNLQAIAPLFELGVGTMLVQFAAHANAQLHWTGRGELVGEGTNVQRALAVLQNARWWFARAALLVVAVVVPCGFLVFGREPERQGVAFGAPWTIATIAVGGYLTIIPFLCFLEGSGQLWRVQKMRLTQAVMNAACLWVLIPLVGSLNAVAVASVANLLIASIWLRYSFPGLARQAIADVDQPDKPSLTGTSIHSAQTKTAVVWIVGFLGPQLLAPLVFRFQGAIAAGQVGLSLAGASAPLMLALSWLQGRYPEYGDLVARNNLSKLDAMATRATVHAVLVCCVGIIGLLGVVALLPEVSPKLASRFLPLRGVTALCATSLAYLLYQAMAAHLRAHREEALLWPIVVGTAAAVAATAAGASRDAMAAVFAYTGAVLGVLLPLALTEFVRRRRFLHRSDRQSIST